jgi:hypothetical protein
MNNVYTQWQVATEWKVTGLPHSSEDNKWWPRRKSYFTGICAAPIYWMMYAFLFMEFLTLKEEIWNSRAISQIFQIHLPPCLPDSLTTALLVLWPHCISRIHPTSMSGKHVNQNTVSIPETINSPPPSSHASLLLRYHQQQRHWITAICCRKRVVNSILHNIKANMIFNSLCSHSV